MNSADLKTEALIEHLILQGGIVFSGIDQNGEPLYDITEKLELLNPEIYYKIKKEFEDNMFDMIYAGPTIMKWKISL